MPVAPTTRWQGTMMHSGLRAYRTADVPWPHPGPQAVRELAVGGLLPAWHAGHQLPHPPIELAAPDASRATVSSPRVVASTVCTAAGAPPDDIVIVCFLPPPVLFSLTPGRRVRNAGC
jgi:hypothetical protein